MTLSVTTEETDSDVDIAMNHLHIDPDDLGPQQVAEVPNPVHIGVPVAEVPNPVQIGVPVPPPVAAPFEVPWDDLFPRKNAYRNCIVRHALPYVLTLLRDPVYRLTSPRDLIDKALQDCKRNGDNFWGKDGVYTRRRSVCDAIIYHYLPDLQTYVRRHDQ